MRQYKFLRFFVLIAFCVDTFQITGGLGEFDFRAWHIAIVILAISLVILRQLRIPVPAVFCAAILAFHTILVLAAQDDGIKAAILQISLFFAGSSVAYSIIRTLGLAESLRIYISAALINAGAIILEEVLYLSGAGFLSNWYELSNFAGEVGIFVRAHGLLAEPSQAAVLVAPAFLLLIHQKRWIESAIIFVSCILTFSTLAFVALFCGAVLHVAYLGRSRGFAYYFAIFFPFTLMVLVGIQGIQERLGEVLYGLDLLAGSSIQTSNYNEAAGSVATLLLNFQIMLEAIKDTLGVGVGFGQFSNAHSKFATILVDIDGIEGLFYNRVGGGSLAIRMSTELGVIGVGLALFAPLYLLRQIFIVIKRLRTEDNLEALHLRYLSLGTAFCVLFPYLIRKDMYFNYYFLFMIAVAYSALEIAWKSKLSSSMVSP